MRLTRIVGTAITFILINAFIPHVFAKEDNLRSSLQASTTAFISTLNSHFESWAHGKTRVNAEDLAEQLAKIPAEGQEAAAIAAITTRLDALTTWEPHDLASINQKLENEGLETFPTIDFYKYSYTSITPTVTITLLPVKDSKPQQYTTKVSFSRIQLIKAINADNSPLYRNYKSAIADAKLRDSDNKDPASITHDPD